MDLDQYLECRYLLAQFYFVNDWVATVANLNDAILPNHEKVSIKRIYEIYGFLMTISKSLDVNNTNSNRNKDIIVNAYRSMIALIDRECLRNGEEIKLRDDITTILENLKALADLK